MIIQARYSVIAHRLFTFRLLIQTAGIVAILNNTTSANGQEPANDSNRHMVLKKASTMMFR